MINFEKFTLDNGLKIIVHKDTSSSIVAFNVLYDVGAKDEQPDKTGFAHLFEHLMFGGSINIPRYDEPLQKAGGENNAFTSNDITNYYITLPKQNLEIAFWLESDRMLSLAFSPKSLDVQKNVVIEEFKQMFLNQPYGDVWLLLRPLAYKVHPYQWPTIGKDISHIENAKMKDVKAFYKKFYNPNNAILSIAGDVDIEKIKKLANKWFAPIKKDKKSLRKLPVEPEQKSPEKLTVKRNVPFHSIYKVFHTCSRRDKEFHTVDLLSDILSNGNSSRLHNELIKKQKLFSEINAFLTGGIENGLFVVSGKLIKGISMQKAEEAINTELDKIKNNTIEKNELQKVKNKIESTLVFSEMNVLNKDMNLAFAELLGDASLINKEIEKYLTVTKEQITKQANLIFRENNCSTLYYFAQ